MYDFRNTKHQASLVSSLHNRSPSICDLCRTRHSQHRLVEDSLGGNTYDFCNTRHQMRLVSSPDNWSPSICGCCSKINRLHVAADIGYQQSCLDRCESCNSCCREVNPLYNHLSHRCDLHSSVPLPRVVHDSRQSNHICTRRNTCQLPYRRKCKKAKDTCVARSTWNHQ